MAEASLFSKILIFGIPAVIAIIVHEAAHGFVAWRLGDPTARDAGRMTFNPGRHIDLVGTILIPGILLAAGARFLFGWAKPVPIDPSKLHNPRAGMVLVAAAGPGINLLLALLSGVLLALLAAVGGGDGALAMALAASVYLNAIIGVFNMIPLPPLDGGRVAVGLLPERLAYPLARVEGYGLYLVVVVLFLVPLVTRGLGFELDIFGWTVCPVVVGVVELIEAVTGADGVMEVVDAMTGRRMVCGW